jgi:hypothetical protein
MRHKDAKYDMRTLGRVEREKQAITASTHKSKNMWTRIAEKPKNSPPSMPGGGGMGGGMGGMDF